MDGTQATRLTEHTGMNDMGNKRGSAPIHAEDHSSTTPTTHSVTVCHQVDAHTMEGEFVEHVHGLPPELFAMIYDIVFTFAGGEVEVDVETEPPIQLHINEASRQQFSALYYENTTFNFYWNDDVVGWMWHHVPATHDLLRSVRYHETLAGWPSNDDTDIVLCEEQCLADCEGFREDLRKLDITLRRGVLRTRCPQCHEFVEEL